MPHFHLNDIVFIVNWLRHKYAVHSKLTELCVGNMHTEQKKKKTSKLQHYQIFGTISEKNHNVKTITHLLLWTEVGKSFSYVWQTKRIPIRFDLTLSYAEYENQLSILDTSHVHPFFSRFYWPFCLLTSFFYHKIQGKKVNFWWTQKKNTQLIWFSKKIRKKKQQKHIRFWSDDFNSKVASMLSKGEDFNTNSFGRVNILTWTGFDKKKKNDFASKWTAFKRHSLMEDVFVSVDGEKKVSSINQSRKRA